MVVVSVVRKGKTLNARAQEESVFVFLKVKIGHVVMELVFLVHLIKKRCAQMVVKMSVSVFPKEKQERVVIMPVSFVRRVKRQPVKAVAARVWMRQKNKGH